MSRCLLLSAACVLAACGTATTTQNVVHVRADVLDTVRRYEVVYRIQAGDQLDVFLNKHQDYSRKVTVRSDGYVSMPLIDEVKAVGKQPKDLAAELKTLFERRLKDPEVSVTVINPPEPTVYVVGQVGAPRALALRQAATVAQALAQAGDATKNGALSDVSVIRLNDQGYLESLSVEPDSKLSQPEVYMAMAAMTLRANDLVLVPESYRSQVLRVLQDTSTAIAPLFNVLILREIYKNP